MKRKHNVSFTQLSAGDYTFKIKSLNNNGVWSKEASALQIEVLPVFWKSNLAYFLYACLGTLSILLGFRSYHQQVKAKNGEDALKILKEENIQLIVSDVMMPRIDGFTLCIKIKTNLETSHIPVILLTSKSAMAAKMEGLESGADAYIEKPFSMKHLKVNIANLIKNRRHIMEHYASSPLAHIRSIANTKTDETFIKKLDHPNTSYNAPTYRA